MTPYRIATAAAALVAAAALAVPAPASASVLPRFAPVHLDGHTGYVHGKNIDGGNWSGYATGGINFTRVSAAWTEPNVRCNSRRDLFAPWVGIDGYGTQTVEQTGVATDCSSGSPDFAGWYEMYPAAPVYYSNPVSPGDHFTATVMRSCARYTLTLHNTTKGWTRTVTKTLRSARHITAEVIMESPTAAYPDFGRVNFGNAKFNGSPLASFNPDALDASNNGGFEDHTSPITNGTKFHIDYLRE